MYKEAVVGFVLEKKKTPVEACRVKAWFLTNPLEASVIDELITYWLHS